MGKKSLIELANDAGFANINSRASQVSHLMGAVMSQKFESIYFRVREEDRVEILGVVDPRDRDSCALYSVQRTHLDRYIGGNGQCNPGIGGFNIDNEHPMHVGKTVVSILKSYAEDNKK